MLDGIGLDPLGTLAVIVPTWFLLPYLVVVVGGLVSGAVLDLYSSGLSLLALGVPISRWRAALLDGALMIIGAAYIVWVAEDFIGPFQGFLTTMGVLLASWCGIFLADLLLRKRDYDQDALFHARGRYGAVNAVPVLLMLLSAVVGWGLMINYATGFAWQGYLLDPVGLSGVRQSWSGASPGLVFAFAVSFVGYLALCSGRVRRQERTG